MYAEFVTSMGERTGALWLALRGAAEVDDEARELYTRWTSNASTACGPGRCAICSPKARSAPI